MLADSVIDETNSYSYPVDLFRKCLCCKTKMQTAYWDEEFGTYVYIVKDNVVICNDCVKKLKSAFGNGN